MKKSFMCALALFAVVAIQAADIPPIPAPSELMNLYSEAYQKLVCGSCPLETIIPLLRAKWAAEQMIKAGSDQTS